MLLEVPDGLPQKKPTQHLTPNGIAHDHCEPVWKCPDCVIDGEHVDTKVVPQLSRCRYCPECGEVYHPVRVTPTSKAVSHQKEDETE